MALPLLVPGPTGCTAGAALFAYFVWACGACIRCAGVFRRRRYVSVFFENFLAAGACWAVGQLACGLGLVGPGYVCAAKGWSGVGLWASLKRRRDRAHGPRPAIFGKVRHRGLV